MKKKDSDQLTLFAGDSPANHSPQQESEKERRMIATSGRKCLESSRKLGQVGSLVKTLLESSRWTAGLYSRKYALRLEDEGYEVGRLLFQLYPKVRPTDETEFGLLLTPNVVMREESPEEFRKRMDEKGYDNNNQWCSLAAQVKHMDKILPTPNKRDHKGATGWENQSCLPRQIEDLILPTPAARDYRGANSLEHLKKESDNRNHLDQLPNAIALHGESTGMKLQPAFVEWMMGYPPGWTDIGPND
jgi:hypothetical protein